MKTIMKLGIVTTALCVSVGSAFAVTLLEWQGGDTGDAFSGWSDSVLWNTVIGQPPGLVNVSSVPGGGNAVGGEQAIAITAAETLGDFNVYASVFSTTAANLTGNLNAAGAAGIAFDFYADGTPSSGLGFYFQSAVDSSVWYYDITDALGAGWNTYSVSFGDSAWYGFADNSRAGAASITLAAALDNVAAIGMYTYFNPNQAGVQTYGIDDFGLTVPEPETYMALGMALLGMAVVFRKRITETLDEARAKIQV